MLIARLQVSVALCSSGRELDLRLLAAVGQVDVNPAVAPRWGGVVHARGVRVGALAVQRAVYTAVEGVGVLWPLDACGVGVVGWAPLGGAGVAVAACSAVGAVMRMLQPGPTRSGLVSSCPSG